MARIARPIRISVAALVVAVGILIISNPGMGTQVKNANILRIGTSGSLAEGAPGREDAALDTLKSFIKSETGFENEIVRLKNWQELLKKLSNKDVQVGVFQGYEYAWARKDQSALSALAIAVNVHADRF